MRGMTGPEAPLPRHPVPAAAGAGPAGPPPGAVERTSGRVIAGFVIVLIGLLVPFLWLLAVMLACDVQEELEKDPLYGPRGLNVATFVIAPIAVVTSTVISIAFS
jgi:hypothetical protein